MKIQRHISWAVALPSLAIVAAIVFIGNVGQAQPIGPFLDFRSNFNAPPPGTMFFEDTGCLLQGPAGCAKFGIKDRVKVTAPSFDFNAAGFIFLDSDDLDLGGVLGAPPFPGNLGITTFYGVDADPFSPNDGVTISGFDASIPRNIFSEETIIGITQDYAADSLGTFAIGDLASEALFTGFDFSRFVGDPSAVVYAFRAIVPFSEIEIVPEPSTLLLAALGGILSSISLRRRKRE